MTPPDAEVRPYQPDNGFSPGGALNLIVAMGLIASAMGYAAYFVSQWIYLILLFPILIGAAVGWMGARMVRTCKIRNPWLGGAAGFVAGVFAMLVMHYSGYSDLKSTIRELPEDVQAIAEMSDDKFELASATIADDQDYADLLATREALLMGTSFTRYMNDAAKQGVSIGSVSSGDGFNLGYAGTYIYWVIEVIIVAIIVFATVRNETGQPFCETCDEWKPVSFLGSISDHTNEAFVASVQGGVDAVTGITPSDKATGRPGLLLYHLARCTDPKDTCTSEVILSKLKDEQGNTDALALLTYPPTLLAKLETLFKESADETGDLVDDETV